MCECLACFVAWTHKEEKTGRMREKKERESKKVKEREQREQETEHSESKREGGKE